MASSPLAVGLLRNLFHPEASRSVDHRPSLALTKTPGDSSIYDTGRISTHMDISRVRPRNTSHGGCMTRAGDTTATNDEAAEGPTTRNSSATELAL